MLEGGAAIKSSSRINQLNVQATLNKIYKELLPKLGIEKKDTAIFGSAGKKDPSKNGQELGSAGDIDLGISLDALLKHTAKEKVYSYLEEQAKKAGYEVRSFPGIGVVSLGFPIENKDKLQENKLVQLDLMPVSNLRYSEWSYYSPGYSESPWKGLYRNEILYALARHVKTETLESGPDSTGKEVPIRWSRLFYDLKHGLCKGEQSIVGKKGLLKKPETISKKIITKDPQEIIRHLFGAPFPAESIKTWEGAWKALMSKDFGRKALLGEILLTIKNGIEKKGYPVPKELEDELKKHLAAAKQD